MNSRTGMKTISLDEVDELTPLDRFRLLKRPRAGLLARASVDINGLQHSVESQEETGTRIAHKEGYDLPPERIWIDNAVGASDWSRAQGERHSFESAMEAIRTRAIDVLIMKEISRATRKNREWVALFDAAAEHGIILNVNGTLYDLTNTDHAMALGLNAVVAVGEVSRLRTRINQGRRTAVRGGRPMGGLAYGYKRVYNDRGGLLEIIEHPEQGPVVRWLFCRWAHPHPPQDQEPRTQWGMAALLNRRGVPSPGTGRQRTKPGGPPKMWLASSVKRLLENPRYIRKYVWRGQIVEGVDPLWPALIDTGEPCEFCGYAGQDTWDRTQAKFQHRADAPLRRTAKWMMTGLMVCEVCGGVVRKGGTAATVLKYVCRGVATGARAGCTSIRLDIADQIVTHAVVARLSSPDLAELYAEPVDDTGVARARARLAQVQAEIAGLPARVEEHGLDLLLANAELRRLQREEEELRPLAEPRMLHPLVGELAVPDPQRVLEGFESLALTEKRDLIVALADRITLRRSSGRHSVEAPELSIGIEWRRGG